MPLLAAYIVRISDRCIISSYVGDRAVEDIRGELLTRCGSPDFRTSTTVQLPSEPRKVGVHVLTDSTTGVVVVSDEMLPRRKGQEAVDEVAKLFQKMYPEGIVYLTPKQGDAFGRSLEGLVTRMSASPSGSSHVDEKARQVRQTVEEVKTLALENVEKVLERGAKIDDIVTQTDQLSQNAEGFHRSSRDLRNQMWWNNVKTKLMIAGVVGAFLLIIWVVFCGGLSCSDSSSK